MATILPGKPLTALARCTRPTSNVNTSMTLRFNSTLQAHAQAHAQVKTAPSSTLPPLSALPTRVLLRSLLVSTISSKRFLLIPALSLMSFLSKPNRIWLFDVDRNPLLHGVLKKTFYNQFCAGENGAECRTTIKEMKDMGFRGMILTYAAETVFDHSTQAQHGQGVASLKSEHGAASIDPSIEAWREGTVETIYMTEAEDYLAVKLTGAGVKVTKAFAAGELPPQQMMDALHEVCTKAKDRKVRILVDAESQHFQKGIARVAVELMRTYNRDGYSTIYNTYQAYLKSTPATLANHLAVAKEDGFTLGLKLVRGAYMATDERSLIHDTKEDTDNAYNMIAQGALRKNIGEFGDKGTREFPSVNLFLASHNKESVVAAHELHKYRVMSGLPTVPVRFAQLHGMSDEVSFSLLQMNDGDGTPEVYKCSTWGGMGECLAYLLRRAIENRDAVLRTDNEYRALKTEVFRRVKSVFSLAPSS
ncbi:Proline oxidase [Penicillium expansum]|uniref:Proline dehydrogenase n=1 Tax=Penicillium expansum TaxID=27334 RepID=A0A0A2JZM5_PENEN|nr:Proline oxidase [Penicillium expansum]KGO41333.1 Proline oxidase [Penicillium expansum]KGO50128.1 Proline oxidase [Penicillium expansum]KGO60884.1 Proline oxidase [Penicillium expansum]